MIIVVGKLIAQYVWSIGVKARIICPIKKHAIAIAKIMLSEYRERQKSASAAAATPARAAGRN